MYLLLVKQDLSADFSDSYININSDGIFESLDAIYHHIEMQYNISKFERLTSHSCDKYITSILGPNGYNFIIFDISDGANPKGLIFKYWR